MQAGDAANAIPQHGVLRGTLRTADHGTWGQLEEKVRTLVAAILAPMGVGYVLDHAGPDSTLADALAIAGQTGTIATRFVGTPAAGHLRAKTGTLNQVSALVGYLDTTPGVAVSFTCVTNLVAPDTVGGEELAVQDQVVAALDAYPQGPSLAELGPQPVP